MEKRWEITSPAETLRLIAWLTDSGALQYSVYWGDEPIIEAARIAIDIRPGGVLLDGLTLQGSSKRQRDERYRIVAGKSSEGHDYCHELELSLKHGDVAMVVTFRAYDDAAAFRYAIASEGKRAIIAELSEFRFSDNHACWAMELPHFQSSFESEFHARRIADIKPGQLVSCPLTILTASGTAVTITEAGLSDFAGMYLEGKAGDGRTLVSRLAPRMDGVYGSVVGDDELTSPWRVIQVADSPAKLIESNVLYALNAPCKIADTAWIRPGRVTWDWWGGHAPSGKVQRPGMNNETMMDHIDLAAEMKLEYMLVDGGWYSDPVTRSHDVMVARREIDVPMLVKYASDRGVALLLWNHQKDLVGKLDETFALYEKWGVRGVKVDFFDRDDQQMVRWAQEVVETAARHKLMVDLHGIYKPTGVERTWPNLMTHEGVMGAEYNKWSARITPEHNVTIPFTRMLAGPMDYTPGGFANVTKDQFKPRNTAPMVIGTRCHHLAMYVVYQSAWQMISDYPDAVRSARGREFLERVPAAWDQTLGLAGEIGEYAVIARRKGDTWFVGAMTNSAKRDIDLPLTFLSAGEYRVVMFVDGDNAASDPTSVMRREARAVRSGTIAMRLAPAGGFAAFFEKV